MHFKPLKNTVVILLFVNSLGYGQITFDKARDSTVRKYQVSSYSNHEKFIGRPDYGAPLIHTKDGGAAAFGDYAESAMIIKLDKSGMQQWRQVLPSKGDEMESQSVVEDKSGNFYLFMLVYDNTRYRGGCQRVIFLNNTGTLVWDKYIGSCNVVDNPRVSYIRALNDGRIALRGQI